MSSMGNLDKEIELELLEIKEENPNFSIFLETYQQYYTFLGKQIDPLKAETCVYDMLALGLQNHQPLFDNMSSNWDKNMSVQDWMKHFNPEYRIIELLVNFEEVIEVLKFKIEPNITLPGSTNQGLRRSKRTKTPGKWTTTTTTN